MAADGLDLWLYGTRAAHLRSSRRGVELDWTQEALSRWGVGSRVLSHLLPVGTEEGAHPARVRVWLDGLLPEGRSRTALAVDRGVDPEDPLALLTVLGRDVPGAAILVPVGSPDPTGQGHAEPIDPQDIADMLRLAAHAAPVGRDRYDSLTSLPGFEPKIALVRRPDGTWVRPVDGAASTHILKLSRPAGSATADLIDTEAAALDLARRVGLSTGEAWIETFEDQRSIVVTRFDRVAADDGAPAGRVHQEDLAQALGIATADPERKFQRGRAVPSYRAAAQVLLDGASTTDQLLALVTLTVAVGDTDAHAKNLAFLHRAAGDRTALAPAYDVSMHMHSPAASGALALTVAGRQRITTVTGADLIAEGISWGMSARRATRTVIATLDRLAGAMGEIDRDRHAGVTAQAWQTVERRVRDLARSL